MTRTREVPTKCCRECGEEKPKTTEHFYWIGRYFSARCRPCDSRVTAARNKERYASDWVARVLAYARMHDRSSPSYEPCDLDRDEIETLSVLQDGRCGWTGVRFSTEALGKLESVSLDRLDASRGYVKGNVMLTCLGANLARNRSSEAEMMDFVARIKATKWHVHQRMIKRVEEQGHRTLPVRVDVR